MSAATPSALVLAAGLGTRLRPLTLVRAKPAAPVAGTPLVLRILRWLRAHGVGRVVLNLHHRPETITRIVGDGRALGFELHYSWEQPILGSAGGPRRALPLLETDPFLFQNIRLFGSMTVIENILVGMHTQLKQRGVNATLGQKPFTRRKRPLNKRQKN